MSLAAQTWHGNLVNRVDHDACVSSEFDGCSRLRSISIANGKKFSALEPTFRSGCNHASREVTVIETDSHFIQASFFLSAIHVRI